MSFEESFLNGYKIHAKNFEKWCGRLYPILGKITQCGIMELDSTGHAFIATNRPDHGEEYLDKKGYLLDSNLAFIANFEKDSISVYSSNRGYELMHLDDDSLFGNKCGLHYGFIYRSKIDNDTQRFYFFGSDTPEIYNEIINNLSVFKKFLQCFKDENKDVINYFRERKFNLADKKDNFFVESNYQSFSERAKLNSLLHTVGVLDSKEKITPREWQCMQLYCQGKSASRTGEILGISRRTVETHFNHLKIKLRVSSKSELINALS